MGAFEADEDVAMKYSDGGDSCCPSCAYNGHLEGQRIGWTARGKAVLPLLEEISGSARTLDDDRMGYVEAQIDRITLDDLAAIIAQIRAEGKMGTSYDRAGEGE